MLFMGCVGENQRDHMTVKAAYQKNMTVKASYFRRIGSPIPGTIG